MWICTTSLPPSSFSLRRSGSHEHAQPPVLHLHSSAVWSTPKSTPDLLCALNTEGTGTLRAGLLLDLVLCWGVVFGLCPHPGIETGKFSAKIGTSCSQGEQLGSQGACARLPTAQQLFYAETQPMPRGTGA